jgi:hypothetical protein
VYRTTLLFALTLAILLVGGISHTLQQLKAWKCKCW